MIETCGTTNYHDKLTSCAHAHQAYHSQMCSGDGQFKNREIVRVTTHVIGRYYD